ncbi:MAG: transglycosylase SLT domain-containing protein [Deltaproteobacteria bacterium]|nr:transglycosylase SLT domain-containing protein [Deltaproteobacteria bacterium]MBW2415088.1 transglycosylase SLT domain-containing protein [Deltaproteobacteria bacterium]
MSIQPRPPRPAAPSGPSFGRNWRLLAAALLLLGAGGAAGPVRDALTGPWERWTGPDALGEERGRIVTRVLEQNPRLGTQTAGRIAQALQRCHSDHGVSPHITLAVMIVESDVRPSARSPKGAIGLMQVMPHMFDGLGLPGNIAHIETNIEAGCMLLADNIRRLGEDRGISAYFWGSWIRGTEYLSKVNAVRETLEPDLPTVSAGNLG